MSYLISFTVQLHRRLGSKFVRSLGINPGGETWFTSGFICPLFHPHGLRQRQHCLGSSSPPSRVASPRQVGRGRAPQEAAHRPRREGRREPCWALSPPHPSGRPMANRAPPAGAILACGAGRSATPPPPGPGEPRPPPASPRTRPPQSSALHPLLSRGRASFRPLPPRFVGQPLALPRRGDPAPRPQTAGPPAGATMKTQSPINYDDARR